MTGLRLTRRRILGAVGGLGTCGGALYALPPLRVSAAMTIYEHVLEVRNRQARSDEFESLDAAVRDPVRQAIEDEYATDDPSAPLREYFDDPPAGEQPVVHYDGRFYRLSASFPVYVVQLRPATPGGKVDPWTVDELTECTSNNEGYYQRPPIDARREAVRRYRLDPGFRRCVERNPYLDLDGEIYRWSITVEDPGAPYRVRAAQVSARELADIEEGAVGRWAELSEETRAAISTAEQGTTLPGAPRIFYWDDVLVTNSLADAVLDEVGRYDYVRREDTFLMVELTRTSDWPLSVDVTVTGAETREFDPAWLELSLSHDGDAPVVVETDAPAPFGYLLGWRDDGDEGSDLVLWSPAYGDAEYDHVFGGRVEDHSMAAHAVNLSVPPGEVMTSRYAVRRDPGRLAPGEYAVPTTFRMRRPDAETRAARDAFPAVMTLTVERSD